VPYNGNGIFSTVYNWPTDKANGIKIRADRMQGQDDDMATGFSTVVTRDGQSPATANLPMGGFKHTGVDAATAADEYLRADQAQSGELTYFTTAGDGTAYTLTPAPAIAALAAGQAWDVRFHTVNVTTTPTLQISGLAATTMVKNGATALLVGDLQSTSIKRVTYDGANYQVSNTFIGSATADGGNALALSQTGTGAALSASSTPGAGRSIIADGISKLDVMLENVPTSIVTVQGTITLDIASGRNGILFLNTMQGNVLPNLRGGVLPGGTIIALNSILGLVSGNAASLSLFLQNGLSAFYINQIQIDDAIVAVNWQGTTAPAQGNASSLDLYHILAIKTANAQYRVIASQTQFR
jgi:hypothetical protein